MAIVNKEMKTTAIVSIVGLALALIPVCAVGKRTAPEPVVPVLANDILYSAEGDGVDGYVVATDIIWGNVLWKVKVFHNRMEKGVEHDLQWIFITDLRLGDRSHLVVRDEALRCYSVDLDTKSARRMACAKAFPRMVRSNQRSR